MATDSKQSKLGGSSVDTYFKRQPITKHEKIIEAFYFFNNDKKSKHQYDVDGKVKWHQIKSDEVSLKNYLRKHQQVLQRKRNSSFFQ